MKTTSALVTAAAMTLAAGCSTPAPPPAASVAPLPVTIDRAAVTNVTDTFEAGGVVRSRLTATIASRVMAPVASVHVKAGDRVRRGAPLVTLDARELTANAGRAGAALTESAESVRAAEADVHAAEAALRLARATYDRIKTLHDSRSATPQELDEATTALSAADARLTSARARVSAATAAQAAADAAKRAADVTASYAVLTAPFDGSIAERFVDPGTMASPGTSLIVVEDPSTLRLEVQIDEARAGGVRVGQDAEVSIDSAADAGRCAARVAEIARVNAASHNFVVKLDIAPDAGIRTGAFGRAWFAGRPRRAVTVAETSLVRRGQLTFVYIVSGGAARLRAIAAGPTSRGRTEVLAGLADGDVVVTNPPPALIDGSPVKERR